MSCVLASLSLLRTQETLDEGVERVRAVYKNFANVGIKDRSMIWNSYVPLVQLDVIPVHRRLIIVISSRRLSFVTSCNAPSRQLSVLLLVRNLVVLTPVKITRRFVLSLVDKIWCLCQVIARRREVDEAFSYFPARPGEPRC